MLQSNHTNQLFIGLLLLAVVAAPSTLSAQSKSWAQLRGPNVNGISPETGINKDWKKKPPKVLWKIKLTDQGHAIPAIADGKALVFDHNGDTDIVKALDLKTGKELWKYPYKDASKQKWGFTRCSLVCHNGTLITQSRNGKLICFDINDGKIKWQVDYVKDLNGKIPMWGYGTTPVIDGDKLIISPNAPGAYVATLDINTGKTIWKGGGDVDPGYGTPVVAEINDVKQYVYPNKFGLGGVSAKDGKLLWKARFVTKYGNNIATPIVFNNNHVFITAGYNHGCGTYKVTGNKAEKLWENGELKSQFNTPVMVGNYIYGIGDPGKLLCIDPMTGKVKWSKRGFGKGGLLVVDGTIIATDGSSGTVIMAKLDPEKYTELGRISPMERDKMSWTPPILADKKLLVRTRGEMACIDLAP